MEQEKPKHVNALDAMVQDRQLQMMKTAVPYINPSSQGTFAFFIKFMELRRTMSVFGGSNSLQMCSAPETAEPLAIQLLSTMLDFSTEQERENIDTLLNYVQMFSAGGGLFT